MEVGEAVPVAGGMAHLHVIVLAVGLYLRGLLAEVGRPELVGDVPGGQAQGRGPLTQAQAAFRLAG